jgi:5-methylcytosine-specific restriction endonuclease McrA
MDGRAWPVTSSVRALKFNIPCHAALRREVFRRDGFKCRRCDAKAVNVPADYSGRYTLGTDTKTGAGSSDALIVDHIVTRPAGGLNVPSNLQTLCETCNRRKQKEDKAATAAFSRGAQA